MQFLNGFNDSYSQARTQILMIEPSPSIDKAFSLVIQEEMQRCLGFTVAPSVESTALAVKDQGFNQGNPFLGNNGKNVKGNNAKGRLVCRNGNGPGFCIPEPDLWVKTRDLNSARLLIGFFFFFFFRGLDPPCRAPFSRLGPNLAQPNFFIFILSPLRFFARFKPIQAH